MEVTTGAGVVVMYEIEVLVTGATGVELLTVLVAFTKVALFAKPAVTVMTIAEVTVAVLVEPELEANSLVTATLVAAPFVVRTLVAKTLVAGTFAAGMLVVETLVALATRVTVAVIV